MKDRTKNNLLNVWDLIKEFVAGNILALIALSPIIWLAWWLPKAGVDCSNVHVFIIP